MAKDKTKKAKQKQHKTSKKQSKSNSKQTTKQASAKQTKTTTARPASPTQPIPAKTEVVIEPIAQPTTPDPAPTQPATLVVTTRKSMAGAKVLAQIGRHIVHSSNRIADELVITDMTTGKPVANIHENVPLPVIRWIIECAESIQDNPTMDAIVKRHGMTNVKAFCQYATGLELSKYQAPPVDAVRAQVVN